MSLEAIALERQQRLQRLRQRKQLVENEGDQASDLGRVTLLQSTTTTKRQQSDINDDNEQHTTTNNNNEEDNITHNFDSARTVTIEEKAQRIAEEAKLVYNNGKNRPQDMDLRTLAPQKLNWDLERDVAKRLRKLDRMTKIAIAELIRQRLQTTNKKSTTTTTANGDRDLRNLDRKYKDIAGAVRAYVGKPHQTSKQTEVEEEDIE